MVASACEHVVRSDGSGPVAQARASSSSCQRATSGSRTRPAAGRAWSTGLVEAAAEPPVLHKGTLLEGAGAAGPAPVADSSRCRRSCRASSTSCSSRSRSRTCSWAARRPASSGPLRRSKAPPRPAPRVSLRAAPSPSRRSAFSTRGRADQEDRHDASDDRTRCSRTRPAIQSFINGQAFAVRAASRTSVSCSAARRAATRCRASSRRRGVPVYAGGTAAGNKAVQLFKAMNGMRGSAFVEPEWIVMHPTDYQELIRLADATPPGSSSAAGRSMGPYGSGQQPRGVRAGDRARSTRSGTRRI